MNEQEKQDIEAELKRRHDQHFKHQGEYGKLTVEENVEKLISTKIDVEIQLDPLFQKVTQDFDRVDHLLLNKGIIDTDLVIQLESDTS